MPFTCCEQNANRCEQQTSVRGPVSTAGLQFETWVLHVGPAPRRRAASPGSHLNNKQPHDSDAMSLQTTSNHNTPTAWVGN
jgi:hypothetical protein